MKKTLSAFALIALLPAGAALASPATSREGDKRDRSPAR